MTDFGEYFDFADLLEDVKPRQGGLPGDLQPTGTAAGRTYAWAQDGSGALVLALNCPEYQARLLQLLAAGLTELLPPESDLVVEEINVVNTAASPVSLKLYLAESAPVGDEGLFGCAGTTLAAGANWQWQGALAVLAAGLYVRASAGGSLVVFLTVRANGVRP